MAIWLELGRFFVLITLTIFVMLLLTYLHLGTNEINILLESLVNLLI